MSNLKTYRGNCHCAAFIYEVTVPEITTISACDCSICSKKGALWAYIEDPSEFKYVKGREEDLSVYTFNAKDLEHKFCPNCGSALLGRRPTGPPESSLCVNTRCFQDFDTWSKDVHTYKNRTREPLYKPTPHTGPLPTAEVENGRVYQGSCHCGLVTLAARLPPLDSSYTGKVTECNCSICQRTGCLWTYPTRPQVVISGMEHLGDYRMGSKMMSKKFCKNCGVHVTNMNANLSQEEIDALAPEMRVWWDGGLTVLPLNLRVLDGDIDLGELKAERFDGFEIIKPKYVNP